MTLCVCVATDTSILHGVFSFLYTGLQKVCISPYFALFCCLTFGLLFIFMIFSYIPYVHFVQVSNNGATHLALADAAVQCGRGSSDEHRGINLEGSLKDDSLQSDFNAWLVNPDSIKLYSQNAGPFPDGYTLLNGQRYVRLLGWSEYLWKGSVISGYCCVGNLNNTEATASLHLFTDDEDVNRFREGKPAENYELSENVTVPPETEHCFTKWGENNPFLVTKSSYHFFILKVSENNMNFTSEISLLQNYVNTSDYTDPHQFEYNSHTFIEFPNDYSHPTEYLTICQTYSNLDQANLSHPDAESIHIRSWNSPYYWKYCFIISTVIGCVGLILAFIVLFCRFCWARQFCGYFDRNIKSTSEIQLITNEASPIERQPLLNYGSITQLD